MNAFVSRSPSVPKVVSATAAAYAIVGGCLSLLGWMTDIYRLTDWWGTGITIKANASIAFCTAGAALLIAVLRPAARRVIQTLAILTALIGGLTLFEHVTRVDLGIDTLLFDEPSGTAGTASPGRMGPPASTSFFILGIALLLLTGGSRSRSVAAGLATAVLGVGTLSLTGFFYGAEAMYAVPRLTGIATQTATMIASMSLGIIAAQPDRQPMQTLCEDSTAGVLARRLLPAAFIMPLTLGWLRVEGERAQLYDYAFGSALRTVIEIAILGWLSWWIVQAVRMRDQQRRRAEEVRRSLKGQDARIASD